MIKTRIGDIPESALNKYYAYLINQVYKILPMAQEKCQTLNSYLNNLQKEIAGNFSLFDSPNNHSELITLLSILEYLRIEEYDISVCKSQVFKMINLIEKLKTKL